MRNITEIILHCTDTDSNVKPEAIRNYHINHNHWIDCGYHFLIDNKANVHPMRPVEKIGAHCKGHNRHSIGIAYIGRTVNASQVCAIKNLICYLSKKYDIAKISTHHFYNHNKTCPNMSSLEFNYCSPFIEGCQYNF